MNKFNFYKKIKMKKLKIIFNANKKIKERMIEMIQTDLFQFESVMKLLMKYSISKLPTTMSKLL
jgi:hypothetical protein